MPPIRRVRQHVNPLSSKYANPAAVPDWAEVYAHPERPLHLDVGCGKGDFVREMAGRVPAWNFLGLEIREPLVERALMRRDQAGQENLHFVFCNANNSLRPLLIDWPGGCPLRCVSIQFPDPWFKKRHQKRRVVQPELVAVLAELMPTAASLQAATDLPGQAAMVWLQSDIEAVCVEMCDRFDENPAFVRQGNGWLSESPFPAQTDREQVTAEKGLPVYRAKYLRR